jgi:hypothetical protein
VTARAWSSAAPSPRRAAPGDDHAAPGDDHAAPRRVTITLFPADGRFGAEKPVTRGEKADRQGGRAVVRGENLIRHAERAAPDFPGGPLVLAPTRR